MDDREATRGIRAKINRARTQIEQLDTDINAFNDRHPYTARKHSQPDSHVWVYGARFTEPIPVEWGVALGEIVHNLRSALDHCVYLLAFHALGKRPPKRTGFPIFNSEKDWTNKGGAKQIKDLGQTPRSLIESLQPYRNTELLARNLLTLNMLWNQDKHRVIHAWGLRVNRDAPHDVTTDPPFKSIHLAKGVIKEDAELFRLVFDEDPLEVHVQGSIPVNAAFNDPADPDSEQSQGLWRLYDSTVALAELLLTTLGQQDRPLF